MEAAPPPVVRQPVARVRPAEIPWPDAFEPRPNFRKRDARNWSWLLLVPIGIIVAIGVGTLDPVTVRAWLDTNVFGRTTQPATVYNSLLPAPFRAGTGDGTLNPAAAPVERPNPTPPLPTSPVPAPPGAEVSPPPPEPAAAAATAATPAAPIHVVIQYRRNAPGADGEARRIAALLQNIGGSLELHPTGTPIKTPTVTYNNPADKAAASALADTLSREGTGWVVRAGTDKTAPGTVEIWLP